MIRNFKVLGLALAAVFAMSAVGASGASAQTTHTFTSELAGTTFLTGTSETGTIDKFTVASLIGTLAVECHGSFKGSQTGTAADEVTITPSYTNCKFNGAAATVDVGSTCDYKFDSDTDANGHAKVKVEGCSATETSKMIAVTNSLCDMYFTNQTAEEGVTYTNVANHAGTGKTAITVKATVKAAISHKITTEACFGTANTGTYESSAIVTGFSDSAHTKPVNISISTP
jgi:hypothetical protein